MLLWLAICLFSRSPKHTPSNARCGLGGYFRMGNGVAGAGLIFLLFRFGFFFGLHGRRYGIDGLAPLID